MIFNTIPIAANKLTSDVTPQLKNGSGKPVLGRSFVTTPILINVWNAIYAATPQHISRPSKSLALTAVIIHSTTIVNNKKIVIKQPTNPSSSPITANIKSFCASAIYPAFLSVDGSSLLRPLPDNCPEPIA